MEKRKRRGLPKLTALQFLVVGLVLGEVKRAKEVREKLRERGVRLSRPSLYRLIARLERSKWIEGIAQRSVVEGKIKRERRAYEWCPGIVRCGVCRATPD